MDDLTAFKTLEPVVDHAPGRQQRDRDLWRSHHSDRDRLVYFSPAATADIAFEVLVAADIVKTIAHELTSMSLILLAGLVLVRTCLSWTLVLEIEGRWPWQREPSPMSSRAHAGRETDAH